MIEMGEDYKFGRFDIVEIDDEKFAVKYEDNTIPEKVDARLVEYGDRFLLTGNDESLGSTEVLEKDVAENPQKALEYLEDNYSPDSDDEALEELISF
ncbi:MAG: hypothetical protein R6V35_00245 [Candidatus Nanohaloarchaea archaeon]